MTFSLNTIILEPLSKKKPKNAVILCHGYGGDGKDISILASYWRAHLPDTIIVCPDAPEKCAARPTGFQWFDLMDQSTEHLSKNIISRPNIILMHGDLDQVVPIESLLEAKEFFGNNNYEIETKIFKHCEHRIPTEGSSLGLQFIKKTF